MSKTLKLLGFILFLPFVAFAEYNGHQVKFSIQYNDGNEIFGYNYVAFVYRKDESTSYKEFLETNYELVLRNQTHDSMGEFAFFENRIKYDYEDFEGEKRFIYTLIDKKKIGFHNIKNFKIIELTDQSYAIGISTHHKVKDRLWMKNKPIEKYAFGGVFCSHNIYIHEKNNETDNVINGLKRISLNFEKEIEKQQNIMNNSDREEYYKAKEKIKKMEEAIETKISDALQRLDGMKVVVITMCTC